MCKLTLCNYLVGAHVRTKGLKSFDAYSDLFYHIVFTTCSLFTLGIRPGESKFYDARLRLAQGTNKWLPSPPLAACGGSGL